MVRRWRGRRQLSDVEGGGGGHSGGGAVMKEREAGRGCGERELGGGG